MRFHRRHAFNPLDPPWRSIAAAIALIIIRRRHGAVGGRSSLSTTIAGGALEMWQQGEQGTAVVVAFCAGSRRGLHSLHADGRSPGAMAARAAMGRRDTAMGPLPEGLVENEVMILGTWWRDQIAGLATVEPGIGMYAMARWWCYSGRS
jgi:hypothetical protein